MRPRIILLLLCFSLVAFVGCASAGADDDAPPKIVRSVIPEYPPALFRAGITGSAVVVFIVDERGTVTNAYASKWTHQLFREAAVAAVRKCKFERPWRHGRSASVILEMPISFDITSDGKPSQAPLPTPGLRPGATSL